jgi:hypothetical protein
MNDSSPQPRTPSEEIAGLVERVTFFNEESGFAVLRVKVRGQRDLVTVLGSLPSVSAGEWLTAKGWWVRDKEHGLQFKAQDLKADPPTTSEGVERYLAGGFVKGVGPVLAKKLVGHFGAEVLGVIGNNPADLESVDGIGPKRREKIANAWQEGMQIREIMVFLHSHGVPTTSRNSSGSPPLVAMVAIALPASIALPPPSEMMTSQAESCTRRAPSHPGGARLTGQLGFLVAAKPSSALTAC